MEKMIGQIGEDIATEFLQRQGFLVIDRNWVCYHVGEIDLIVSKGSKLYFVEVKCRSGNNFGTGIESVDEDKLSKLFSSVEEFLLANKKYENWTWQLDVIEVYLNLFNRRAKLRWYKNIN